MKDFLLRTFPNPERKGCPDDKTIQALAEERLPAGDSAGLHVGSCSECYAEYRHYRLDWEERQSSSPVGISIAQPPSDLLTPHARATKRALALVAFATAASLIVIGSGYLAFRHMHRESPSIQQLASSQPVSLSVDLFNSGTLRGSADDTAPLREVYLPVAVVRLSVTLPRFSEAGRYRIDVSTDKTARQVIASGIGDAAERADGKVVVGVSLDLRAARPGAYFLATIRGTDNGTYYYPLKVQ